MHLYISKVLKLICLKLPQFSNRPCVILLTPFQLFYAPSSSSSSFHPLLPPLQFCNGSILQSITGNFSPSPSSSSFNFPPSPSSIYHREGILQKTYIWEFWRKPAYLHGNFPSHGIFPLSSSSSFHHPLAPSSILRIFPLPPLQVYSTAFLPPSSIHHKEGIL